MQKTYLPSLLAGFIAAVLFVAVLALGLGFLFLFLPTLPLFWLGLSREPKQALIAAVAGCLLISLFTDISVGVFFLILLGLPAFYISQLAQLSSAGFWFPIGQIFSRLVFYAGGLIALMALQYAMDGTGLEQTLVERMRAAFGALSPEYAEAVERLAGGLSFLIFSMGIWLWGSALYGHAWFANRQLTKKGLAIRPDFAITPFIPSNNLLFALGICAFASLAGSPQMAYLGKTLLVGFLLPYFFLGASLMHKAVEKWPSRRFFLFFVYFMILAAFWPALVLAVMGLIHHIKHLSGPRDSTRN